ncbi:helix-turn-helix domain-containing protein [Reichenbachiella versicolor]|uniref:helix-turn-helix domain-containing protein n=1 Tax=Reichenbachiella versicolor TaxID=1821036 RepID=UPI000D6E3113|nr:AraC family transcriptional regulator [Reichenbachiella versicolor]
MTNLDQTLEKIDSTFLESVNIELSKIKLEFGTGKVETYSFEWGVVCISDLLLSTDVQQYIPKRQQFLFSFLLEGKQSYTVGKNRVFHEAHHVAEIELEAFGLHINLPKNVRYHEIRLLLSQAFFVKYGIETNALIDRIPRLISPKEFMLLIEILHDSKKGHLKRLFLTTKILELITLKNVQSLAYQIDRESNNSKDIASEAKETIESKSDSFLSIAELAKTVGTNESTLQKDFKITYGLTIFEYTTQHKMELAKSLLKTSDKPIYEIANQIGYKNATHFTAAFKRYISCTPREYRNRSYSYVDFISERE